MQIGDHILVNKFIYGIKAPFVQKTIIPINNPQREDIIVFEFPEDPLLDEIRQLNVDDMTPRQAMDELYRLRNELSTRQ